MIFHHFYYIQSYLIRFDRDVCAKIDHALGQAVSESSSIAIFLSFDGGTICASRYRRFQFTYRFSRIQESALGWLDWNSLRQEARDSLSIMRAVNVHLKLPFECIKDELRFTIFIDK